jgi:hypothetical protein
MAVLFQMLYIKQELFLFYPHWTIHLHKNCKEFAILDGILPGVMAMVLVYYDMKMGFTPDGLKKLYGCIVSDVIY